MPFLQAAPEIVLIAGRGVGERLHATVWQEFGLSTCHIWVDGDYQATIKPRLVVVATPIAQQLAHAHAILNQHPGTPVLLEKPAGLAGKELLLLGQSAQQVSSEIWVNYQLRFHPQARLVSELFGLERPKPAVLRVRYRSSAAKRRLVPAWYLDSSLGGGALNAIGSHILDLLLHNGILGDTTQVRSHVASSSNLTAELQLSASSTLLIDVDVAASHAEFSFSLETPRGRIVRYLDLSTGAYARSAGPEPARLLHPPPELTTTNGAVWRGSYRRFVAHLVEHQHWGPAATLEHAMAVHSLLERLR